MVSFAFHKSRLLQKIRETEQEFDEHLKELRKLLRNSATQYVTVAGIEVIIGLQ
jgi:hypothetical protein